MNCKRMIYRLVIVVVLPVSLLAMEKSDSAQNSPRMQNSPRKLSLSSPRAAGIVRTGSASNVALVNSLIKRSSRDSDEIKRKHLEKISVERSQSTSTIKNKLEAVADELQLSNKTVSKLEVLHKSRRDSKSPREEDEATLVQLVVQGEEPIGDLNTKLRNSMDLKKQLISFALADDETIEQIKRKEK